MIGDDVCARVSRPIWGAGEGDDMIDGDDEVRSNAAFLYGLTPLPFGASTERTL